ncbi:MAG: protein kinase [Deltaproteobacteria bacterium]|nr:protein kinase [Deltaproteobacteria bacterium]
MGVHEGLKIGRYQLGRMLGEGGFGKVFIARDDQLGRDVALKVLLPEHCGNAEILKRFFHEARAAAAIRHAGIVMVFEYGRIEGTGTSADGSAFIAMELLAGESLASRLKRAPALTVAEALAITRQIAAALGAAHAEGIVHRDLKPDNVYLVPDDSAIGGCRVKVLDFGIAKLQGAASGGGNTRTLMVFGTPPYMSPEQCRSSAKIDHRSDIYALGCILFEMLCGRTPFAGDAGELIALHQLQPPPRPSTLTRVEAPLEKVVLAMLAKKADDRPPSMEALRGTLDKLELRNSGARPAPAVAAVPPRITASEPQLVTTLVEASGSRPSTIQTGPARPRRLVLAGAALGVMALGGVGLWLAMKPAGRKQKGGGELADTLTRPGSSPSASPATANPASPSPSASPALAAGKPSFSDDFDRDRLGSGYHETGPGFSLVKGALRARVAGGHPLWLEQPLPSAAQIELDVWTAGKSVFALELWGDGRSSRLSGYRLLMVSDSGQAQLGRDPFATTQVTRKDVKVVPGRTYHLTVRRSGGRIDWLLDDDPTPFLRLDDAAPPDEPTPRFLGLLASGGDVFFDNLVIRPLATDPAAAATRRGPPWPTQPATEPGWAHISPILPAVVLGVPDAHPATLSGFRPARGVTSPSGSYWIQTREVTAKQVAGVLQRTSQAVQAAPAGPALGVGYGTAVDVCRALGGALPTEAEWEYAARGSELRPYPWGSEPRLPASGDATPGPTPIHGLLVGPREWTADIWRNDVPCAADKPDCERYFSDGKEIGVLRGLDAKQLAAPLPPVANATRSRLCRSGPCVTAAAKLLGDVGFRCVRRDDAE